MAGLHAKFYHIPSILGKLETLNCDRQDSTVWWPYCNSSRNEAGDTWPLTSRTPWDNKDTSPRQDGCVWWPAITTAITDMVTKCFTCAKNRPVPKEPLMSSSFPSRPWERLAADLFDLKGKKHLIVVENYSRWTEVNCPGQQSKPWQKYFQLTEFQTYWCPMTAYSLLVSLSNCLKVTTGSLILLARQRTQEEMVKKREQYVLSRISWKRTMISISVF